MTDQLSFRLDAALPSLPPTLRPMLARPADAPFDSADHLFEPSWGGERAIAFVEPDPVGRTPRARVADRRGTELTAALPELADLPAHLSAVSAVFDGELVVVDRAGRPNDAALDLRLSGRAGPLVAYLVFDLLYLDGRALLGEPLERRRQTLRRILRPGEFVVAVPAIGGEGIALHAAVVAQGLAGVMARHRRSPYLPGVRSRLWRFVTAQVGLRGEDGPTAEPEPSGTAPVLALIRRLPLEEE